MGGRGSRGREKEARSATAPLKIQLRRDGGTAVVECAGEIDDFTDAEFTRSLGDAMAADLDELRVDMARVTFVDSTGLRALVGTAMQCESLGIRFRLVTGRPVERLLEVAGLRDLVHGRIR